MSEDSVVIDETGKRSGKKSEQDLIIKGNQFVYEMGKKGIDVKLVKGSLENETAKAAEDIGSFCSFIF